MLIRERARAKINLTLRVLGRRADGYHALESLVSFADVADEIVLDADRSPEVSTAGEFATAIVGENLLGRTLALARERAPGLKAGAVTLGKALPVAAGVGGGSADAAALLRALRHLNPDVHLDWYELAERLGADVPVCLHGEPVLMWGVGEGLARLPTAEGPRDAMPAVLVNPRLPLATRDVFAALDAQLLEMQPEAPGTAALQFASVADVATYLASVGNDLEAPARRLLPAVAEMQAALAREARCLHAGMSGSGPTCFGLFESMEAAQRASAALRQAEPGWWVVATGIAFPAGRAVSSRG